MMLLSRQKKASATGKEGMMSTVSKAKKLVRVGKVLLTKDGRYHVTRSLIAYQSKPEAECPCCGFKGKFRTGAKTGALGKVCPSCKSMARHRLMALAFDRGFVRFAGRKVLHFAPEPIVTAMIRRQGPDDYVTADLRPGRAQLVLNLEQIDSPDDSWDLVVASHVLEHVNDRKAMPELYRILRPGGGLVAMVPMIDGWPTTFEDETKTTPEERARYFGQSDHVRYYGADFSSRLESAGFRVEELVAGPIDSVQYRLSRGSKVFLCTK